MIRDLNKHYRQFTEYLSRLWIMESDKPEPKPDFNVYHL